MIRGLFSLASFLLTFKIVASGNPKRIGKHVGRKVAHRLLSRLLR